MSVGDTVTRTCKTCAIEFPHDVKGQGRHPDYCPPHAAERKAVHVAKYRQGEAYREAVKRAIAKQRETYDPWKWENTILEWFE